MTKKRASAADMEARTNEVYIMRLNGAPRAAILKKAAADWGINTRQTDTLIARADKRFEEYSQTVRERELGKAIARHEDWIQQSLQVKDISEARQNQKELSTLLGLYAPQTVKIISETMTPADAKLLGELLTILKARSLSPGALFAEMMAFIVEEQASTDAQ